MVHGDWKRWHRLKAHDRALWALFEVYTLQRVDLLREVYLFVPCEVFESLKVHFIPEPLRPGHWRTEGAGWHIHAVEEGDVVNIHV